VEDGKNVGFKMDYDPSASPAPAGTTTKNASGALDPNTQMNYSCNPWIVDGSKFTVQRKLNSHHYLYHPVREQQRLHRKCFV